ncbi:MAG: hypothetical protein JOZ82_04850, partial [Marmoricola sp.]|nr:hypothetical protein [Marmoricola sp.]
RQFGVAVDPQRNAEARSDADVSVTGVPVRTVVVAASEEVEVARETRRLLE